MLQSETSNPSDPSGPSETRKSLTSETPEIRKNRIQNLYAANDEPLVVKERRLLRLTLRILMFIALAGLAAGIGYYSYIELRNSEVKQATNHYTYSQTHLRISLQKSMQQLLVGGQFLANVYSTSMKNSSNYWPNATIQNFEMYSAITDLQHSRAISFNPIIYDASSRSKFEEYATINANLLNAPVNIFTGAEKTWKITDGIYSKNGSIRMRDPTPIPGDTGIWKDVLVPVWQISPMSDNFRAIMYNLHSEATRRVALDSLLTTKKAVLTDMIVVVQDSLLDINRPSSILFVPVFDAMDNITLVGTTSVVFTWDLLLEKILPADISDIDVVLSSPKVTYTLSLNDGIVHRIDKDYGTATNDVISVTIYPNSSFFGKYLTLRPMISAIIVVAIIIGVSFLFFIYDTFYQLHEGKLTHMASQSSKMLINLFPKFVLEKMFNSPTAAFIAVETGTEIPVSRPILKRAIQKMRGVMFPQNPEFKAVMDATTGRFSGFSGEILAESFDCVTILFADIAGFTAWSSEQPPAAVFSFLETLYYEFDRATGPLRVFKVETVGDEYMAVTGIPDKDPHHAYNMALFAMKMQEIMSKVAASMACKFGYGTMDLKLRIGIHCGKVIAGVLRGTKSRFQLFGDTVNTASRMESTGIPDKIQISSEIHEHLSVYSDMSAIISERYNGVDAKGKGQLRTFWLDFNSFVPASPGQHEPTISS